MKMNRRRALQRASLAMAGAAACPYIVPSSVFGAQAPSNRIVIGSIGIGGQGQHNMRAMLNQPDTRVVAVCDAHEERQKTGKEIVDNHYGNSDCAVYGNFADLLARPDIDAVVISTPDHWHGLIALAAVRAGKDVYCEKPLTNTIAEGQALLAAAHRHGRVVQTGSHERSGRNARYMAEVVRNGRIGTLRRMIINLPCNEGHHRSVLSDRSTHRPEAAPEGLDFDMWLGPTPMVDYTPRRYRTWRFIMDYGGGEMTDRGAHVIDLAQMAGGFDDTMPISYEAEGRRPDSNLYDAWFDFSFHCRYANGVEMIGSSEEPRGARMEGDDGWIFIHVHGANLEASSPELLRQTFGPGDIRMGRVAGHHRNFLDCVYSRQAPVATAQVGHHSATICHLLNIAMETGRKIDWDPATEQVIGDPETARFLCRPMRAPWRL